MSNTVDSRVVEMKFDNKQFESAVQTSLKTLDKLKDSLKLDKAARGLDSLQKASNNFSLEGMMSSVEALNHRFSTLGIVGMTVIQNLTNSALHFAKNMWDNTIGQIKSGGLARAMNIEQAKFQLKGLEVEWDKISEDINYGVKGTAYGLDAAAKAASQLVASGVEFGEAFGETGNSPMAKALRGISGVAAMTNSSYEEISSIYTTVAGQGKLMTMQLRQLESRGLNAAAQLGKVLGYSEEEIREFVTAGKIDFATFSVAMDRAFGEHAKAANETFSGSLSNVRSALSRIGAKVATVYLEKMRNVFVALIPVIDNVNKALDPFLNIINSGITFASEKAVKVLEKLNKGLEMFLSPVRDFKEQMKEAKEVVEDFSYVEEMAQKVIRGDYGNGEARKKALTEEGYCWQVIQNRVNEIKDNTKRYEVPIQEAKEETEELNKATIESLHEYNIMIDVLKRIDKIFEHIGATVNNAKGAVRNFVKAFKDGIGRTNIFPWINSITSLAEGFRYFVSEFIMGTKTSKDFSDTIFGLTSILRLLFETLSFVANAVMILLTPLTDLASVFIKVTGIFGNFIGLEIEAFEEGSLFEDTLKNLRKFIQPLRNGIKNLSKAIDKLVNNEKDANKKTNILKDAFSKVFDIIAGIGKAIYAFLGYIKDGAVWVYNYVTQNEKLSKVFGSLKNILESVGGAIYFVFTNLKEFFHALYELPAVQNVIKTLEGAFDSLFNLISPYLEDAGNKISEFAEKLKSEDGADCETRMANINSQLELFIENCKTAWDTITGFFSSSDKAEILINKFENIGDVFKNIQSGTFFSEAISGGVSEAFDFEGAEKKIGQLGQTLKDKFGKIDIGKVLGITFGAASVASLLNFAQLENSFARMADNFSGVAGSIKGAIGSVFKTVAKRENISTTILKIAAAIGILAISMVKLSEVPSDKLSQAVKALETLLVTMGVLALVFANTSIMFRGNSLFSLNSGSSIGITMMAIAGSLLVMIGALKLMEHLKLEGINKRIEILVGLIGVLSIIAIMLSHLAPDMSKGGFSLVLMAFAVHKLAKTLILLSNENLANIHQGLEALTTIMFMLAILAISASRIRFRSAAGMLGLIGALIITEKLLMYIAEDFDVALVLSSLKSFLTIFGIMATLNITSAGMSARRGLGMVAMAGSLLLFAIAAKKIGKLSDRDINRTVDVVASLAIVLLSFMAVSELLKTLSFSRFGPSNVKDTLATFIGFAIGMGVLIGGVILLSSINEADLKKATNAIAIVILSFGASISLATRYGRRKNAIATIIAMAISAAGLAFALMQLAKYNWKQLLAAAGAIGITILTLSGSMAIASKTKYDLASVAMLMGAASLLRFVSDAIVPLAEYNWRQLLSAAGAIGITFVALAGSLALISVSSINPVSLMAFVGAVFSVLIIADAIASLSQYNWESLLYSATAISEVLLAMALALDLTTAAGYFAPAAAEGILLLDAFIINLLGLLDLIGGITTDKDIENVEKGIEVVTLLGEAIGGFVAAIIGGFGEYLTSSLESIGENLSTFMDNVSGFVSGVKEVDNDAVTGASNLADAIGTLATSIKARAFKNKDKITQTGEAIVSIGEYVSKFNDILSGENISANKMQAASNSLMAMAEFAKAIPNQGGKLANWMGDNTLSKFGEELEAFKVPFVNWCHAMEFVSPDVIEKSSAAAETVAAFANKIPNQGGKIADLLGDNTLSKFGFELTAFGRKFVTYSKDMENVNTEVVEKSSAAAESVAAYANKIPNQGGKLADWMGDNTLSTFGTEMVRFAFAFSRYVDIMKYVSNNKEIVDASTAAAESVAAFASKLENHDGLLQMITGDNKLSDFGKDLADFGLYFGRYNSYVRGITGDIVDKSIALADSLLALNGRVAEDGTHWWDGIFGKSNIITFGRDLETFGYSLSIFFGEISNVPSSKIGHLRNLISSLASINSYDGEQIKSFSEGLKSLDGSALKEFFDSFGDSAVISDSITNMFKMIVTEIRNKNETMKNSGKSSGLAFINGLKYYVSQAKVIGENYVSSFLRGVDVLMPSVRTSGINVGAGLIRGLDDKRAEARQMGETVGKEVVDSINKGMGNASPSKKTRQSGRYADQGLILGMNDLKMAVLNSAADVGNSAVDALAETFMAISEVIDSDIDMDPTIRPVLDLSNVTTGANKLNAMLSRNRALSIYADGSNIASNLNTEGSLDAVAQPTYNFTQNNYSPKALSRIDIYRQTRNQFAQMKGLAGV
ncbi:MAG: hypothetical protein J6U54_05485 [Clostridiales bacterium]|nr:hypothetical protein [Clostridiales bacterium]